MYWLKQNEEDHNEDEKYKKQYREQVLWFIEGYRDDDSYNSRTAPVSATFQVCMRLHCVSNTASIVSMSISTNIESKVLVAIPFSKLPNSFEDL